jgi:hypothetical protein
METKIQIKSIFGNPLFEFKKEDNSIKETLLEAIKSTANLRSADLRYANLRSANLSSANLRCADLRYANLRYANLRSANLSSADLHSADLQSADLSSANLSSADLHSADLRCANLHSANLSSADLRSANLRCADLRCANLSYATGLELNTIKKFFWILPEEGSFIAWKKLANDCIAKIEIPKESKRTCNLLGRKCRAEFVKTLEIINSEGKLIKTGTNGTHEKKIKYIVGKITKTDEFDDSFMIDCSHGIHFFLTKQEAIDW